MSQNKWLILVLFVSIFSFRSFFGLWQAHWGDLDYIQTYLIGLKSYTTGTWPYFGPDVTGAENTAFQSQIPGALEGLLIGLPFRVLPIPEAPFLLLNFLNTLGVLLLGAYLHRRLPSLSFIWLSLWIASLPWTLHEGTNIINPAFLFLPGVLFFVGFMEATPSFCQGWWSVPWANASMGFGVFTSMQLHFSYVYLLPLAAYSLLAQAWTSRRLLSVLYFLSGALPALALVIPTYLKFGLGTNNVASGFVAPFDWDNLKAFGTILARFLSLACYEMPRFLGLTAETRMGFLKEHPLLMVPGAALWLAGLLQPFILLIGWFFLGRSAPEGKRTQWLILAILLMVEVSFWFTIKRPYSHIFFILLPFVAFYAAQVGSLLKDHNPLHILAKTLIVFSLFFHLLYAHIFEPQYSIYSQKDTVAKAIQAMDYRVLGERRPGSYY